MSSSEHSLYSLDEAKTWKQQYQEGINKIQGEIAELEKRKSDQGLSPNEVQSLRQELEQLMDGNIKGADFNQKLDLLAQLGVVVYPSEDLKSRKISCQLNLREILNEGEQPSSTKVVYGRPCRIIGRTFSACFRFT
jgi:hypothetical protein